VRREKPWFGPIPSIGKAICPVSWEGYAVTVAFLLGMLLLGLESDLIRRSLALALLAAAYCALVILTWGDPDSEDRQGWRETLLNWQTLVWLAVLVALAAAMVTASYQGYPGWGRRHAPGWHAGTSRLR
jgi:peptidoglycan/LPS O-acetylase OafA/YrhL